MKSPRALCKPRAAVAMLAVSAAPLTAVLAPFRAQLGLLNAGMRYLLLSLLIAATWRMVNGFIALSARTVRAENATCGAPLVITLPLGSMAPRAVAAE